MPRGIAPYPAPSALLICVLSALLIPISLAFAQEKQSQSPPAASSAASAPSASPVFKSGVDLVRLDVRALDDQGAPVRDLRADEIEVVEQGQRRPILLFQHVEEPSGTYAEAAARTISGEVSTNQGAPRGHLYVLLFDQDHIAPGNEQRARIAAQAFLRTRLRPQDRVAIYGLPGPGPELNFTSDVHRAIAELDRVHGGMDRSAATAMGNMTVYEAYQIAQGNPEILARVSSRNSQSANDLSSTPLASRAGLGRTSSETDQQVQQLVAENARTVVAQAEGQSRAFLQRAGDVMLQLRRIEGRKSVVLFSEGFFVGNLQHDLERLAAAAAQSYSVVYSFDLNRHVADINGDSPQGGEQGTETHDRIEPLGSLAAETGGELVPAAADYVERALNALANSSQDYYIVGFAPASAAGPDGDYRRIQVRVKRRGVHVSTRSGYARGATVTPADRRQAIDAALHAPYTQQGLQVRYTTYVLGAGAPGARRVVLSLEAELPVSAGTSQNDKADVVFVARRASDGVVVSSGSDAIPLPRQNAEGRSLGIGKYRVQFDLPGGDYLMRAVVREPGGLVGTADRRFTVRQGAADLNASDLIISRPGDALPVRPRLYASDVLTGILELNARTAEQLKDVQVNMDLRPLGTDAREARNTDGEVDPPRSMPNGVTSAVRFDMPLSGVAPGVYLARATVRSGGETVASVVREVEVAAGSEPVAAAATASNREPFDPSRVLAGEVARELMTAVQVSAEDEAVADAAALALSRDWTRADARLHESQHASGFGALVLGGLSAFAARNYGPAAASLDRAASLEKDGRVTFVLGWAHEAAGDHRSAISAWRNAVLIDPKLVPAHLALAQLYEQLGQPALAVQALRAGIASLPDSPELRDRLARLQKTPLRPPS